MKRTKFLALAVVALVIGVLIFIHQRNSAPAGMVPLQSLRKEVADKTAHDVHKILIKDLPLPESIIVTRKSDIEPLLQSLQEAYVEEPQCLCAGPKITVYWKDGKKTYDWGFCISDGPKCAFGPKFAAAYNRVAPPDRKIDLNKVEGQ